MLINTGLFLYLARRIDTMIDKFNVIDKRVTKIEIKLDIATR
jgi:hypothetical protein